MNTKQLIDLAERCELEEASRALDGAIGVALNPDARLWTPTWCSGGPNEYLRWPDPKPGVAKYEQVPWYTFSLDAAMRLSDWVLLHMSDIGADGLPLVVLGDPRTTPAREVKGVAGRTLALTYCAAALKARASRTEP